MANKRQQKKNRNKDKIKANTQAVKSNSSIKKSNNEVKKKNRARIKANSEEIKISQNRAKQFRAINKATSSVENLGRKLGGKQTKASRELRKIGSMLGKTLDQKYMEEQREHLKLLRDQNKLLRAQNKELIQQNKALTEKNKALREESRYMRAEDKASKYDWYQDDDETMDNVRQYVAIKKYYDWVNDGLIKPASVLDKYQYVKYLEEVATPEMLQELVDEYEPALQQVLENERKRREASPVINWSALWG